MGLRINTNVPAINALRNLRTSDGAQQKSLERLSTGLRINRASDDPSGLVISEQLRAQIASMGVAMENSQNAANMISTTEAALNEVNTLLVRVREAAVFAMSTGTSSAEQIDAEQDAIDNAIRSIDRVAQTTKFATRSLLDGSSSIAVTSQAAGVQNVNVQSITFDGQTDQQFTVSVTQIASKATLFTGAAYGGTSANDATIRLTGSEGTQDIVIASSMSVALFDDAVNIYTADTGVYASSGLLYSVDFGSEKSVTLEVVTGTLNAGGGLDSTDGVQTDDGVDIDGHINGVNFSASGHDLRVVSDVLTADIRLTDGVAAGSHTFTVDNSGLTFQLNETNAASDREQVGVRSVHSSELGSSTRSINGIAGTTKTIGGFLSSIVSGGSNDLSTDASNALRIVDDAINQVTDLRAYLGAFQAQTIDSNLSALGVATENLTASESTIRDLDFAQETADFTRNQILYQSGIAVLAQSNLISQSVLTLLG